MKLFTIQFFALVLLCCCITSLAWRSWGRRRRRRATPPPPTRRPTGQGPLQVSRGQITFDSEGNDNPRSIYFSRKPHVPSSSSGITLGRGYDLKERSAAAVTRDLVQAGLTRTIAQKFSRGVGLKGRTAKAFLKNNNLNNILLTYNQQKRLFYIAYDAIARDARRLATKADVVSAYGNTNWNRLNKAIKEVVVDLRYRGDYTPTTRRKIQRAVANNDLRTFTTLMSDRAYWMNVIGVPPDRFRRRKEALERAGGRG